MKQARHLKTVGQKLNTQWHLLQNDQKCTYDYIALPGDVLHTHSRHIRNKDHHTNGRFVLELTIKPVLKWLTFPVIAALHVSQLGALFP